MQMIYYGHYRLRKISNQNFEASESIFSQSYTTRQTTKLPNLRNLVSFLSACHDYCVCVYLFIQFFFITINSNKFSVQFINLVMLIFSNTFSLEFYTHEIQNFVLKTELSNMLKYKLFCSVFSFRFFFFILHNKLCYQDNAFKFSGSILRQFD